MDTKAPPEIQKFLWSVGIFVRRSIGYQGRRGGGEGEGQKKKRKKFELEVARGFPPPRTVLFLNANKKKMRKIKSKFTFKQDF